MELFINQGKDSTIEPAYLVETNQAISEPVLISKTITENDTYNAVDDNADGYSSVTVNVSGGAPVFEDVNITPTTSEQTITAGEGYDGIGTATVEAVTSAIDANITSGNIKKDVAILGVTGSYEGSSGGYNATLEVGGTEAIHAMLNFIGTEIFYTEAKLTSISIPSGVEIIGNYAFEDCISLADVTIPSSVTTIGRNAFTNCISLTNIIIPSSVTTIGRNAFQNCTSLTNTIIPSSVTTIGNNAFEGCTGLTAITIPSSVVSIGSDAFYDCTDLTTITINKAEGSITGAPWGADNATIVWNG